MAKTYGAAADPYASVRAAKRLGSVAGGRRQVEAVRVSGEVVRRVVRRRNGLAYLRRGLVARGRKVSKYAKFGGAGPVAVGLSASDVASILPVARKVASVLALAAVSPTFGRAVGRVAAVLGRAVGSARPPAYGGAGVVWRRL